MELQIKWYDISCFQIKTEDKNVIFDPYLQEDLCGYTTFSDADQSDLVCISHAHYDHIKNLPDVYEQATCCIAMSNMIAGEMVQIFDLSSQLIYPLYPQVEELISDIRVCPHFAHHAIPSRKDRHLQRESVICAGIDASIPKNLCEIMRYGFMDVINYELTFSQGLKILFWSSSTNKENRMKVVDTKVDILFLQLPSNTIEDNLALISMVQPAYVIPHHHDIYYENAAITNKIQEMKKEIIKLPFPCEWVDIESGKWKSIKI